MAFDAELQIVDSLVVDVSENAEQLSTAFDMERKSFPKQGTFVVIFEAASAETGIDPLKFVLQVSVDGGTVYHDIATIDLQGNGAGSLTGPYSVPIGPLDLRAEIRADDDIQVRVAVRYTDAAGTDDFTFSAYLAGHNPYPHFSSVAVYHE